LRIVTSLIASSATGVYTADGADVRIVGMVLTNTNGSAVTVSIWLPTGGAAGNTNIILKDRSLEAGESFVVRTALNQTIPDGSSISASASVAGVVSMVASGVEIATT
jgi:hypothetical protein